MNERRPRLVMTLLVRDEIDIIRENLDFHLRRGVDLVVATDNGSLDGTRDVLREYERDGRAVVIDEPDQDYDQSKWVTRMAFTARDRCGADWILHNDADEFWRPAHGDLKTEIEGTGANVLVCPRVNVVPDEETLARPNRRFFDYRACVSRPFDEDAGVTGRRFPSLTVRISPKIMCAARGLRGVAQGNHGVVMDDPREKQSENVRIYHFPVRNYEQFELKVANGGASYARNRRLPYAVGWHWRRWHEMLQAGTLRAEFDRLVLTREQLELLVEAGRVTLDDAIRKELAPM